MHQPLPMLGRTHGNRSAVTCHLKCDSACAHPVPNATTEPAFADIASRQLSRRSLLVATGSLAAAAALPTVMTGCTPGDPRGIAPPAGLDFVPLSPVAHNVDALTVPAGYRWTPILRWGDPLFAESPDFHPEAPDAHAQELQFGYNNDFLAIMDIDRSGRLALLCCNHEFTNRAIMFPPSTSDAQELETVKATMAAHGFSVVELERPAPRRPWRYVRGAARNRRITAHTPFTLTGAAAGSDLVKTAADPTGRRVLGTLSNCSGSTTPWGTVLSGEENFETYFVADSTAFGSGRYGLTDRRPSVHGWEAVDARFDATQPDYAPEPHRFGYIVEIDPRDPGSIPNKHTALGRFKHEGAAVRVDVNGSVAAYMGDDEGFEYLYKFVARKKYSRSSSAAARRRNRRLLTDGDLYVARFSGSQRPGNANLGQGAWIPLTLDGKSAVPGMTHEEVLVFTRLAADRVKATPMDRCEDVKPNPRTGKVYVACTNNPDRGAAGEPGPDAANPRAINKNGHIIEITERHNRVSATSFTWDLFLVCGDTDEAGTYFGGWEGPVAPVSCPDNLAFDSLGNLWIATDGAPGSISKADGLFRVPLEGDERGHVVQFLAVPHQAETCGPVIHDRDGSVFISVQHPGEDGSWDEQLSYFPDYVPADVEPAAGAWRGPRPSVVQVTRDS